jgi:hypothetical protein
MTPVCRSAGIILAYSNSLAGQLSDVTVKQGLGNIGCFYGGAGAAILSALLLLIFDKFGDLGKAELAVQKAKKG